MEFESTVSTGLQVHIPHHVARHLKLQKGDVLVWTVLDSKVYVVKQEPDK